MEKENLTQNINIDDYGIDDEYYGIANIFNKLWKAREYIQKEMMQQDEMKLKSWALKKNEELKKNNIEVSFEKGKLIFKRKTEKKECGGFFNYYFGNWNDIYKKVAVSYSKKSIVLFHEWKNRNEVIKRRTRGILIDGNLDQKIGRMIDETVIQVRINSDEYKIETCFRKNMKLHFRNVKTNEWFYHEAGKIKKNTDEIQICHDCVKILKMLKSKTVSEFEKKRLSKLIKNIEENFSAGRFVRYSLPKNKILTKETKKEYTAEAESENNKVYRFFDEYCAKESFFYKLWKVRENIQAEIKKEDGLKIKNWVLKNKEELEKYDIEVLFEKGKLIFKYKIDNEKNGKHFNYYFGNKDDIYKKIGLSFSKKSTVLFYEWKNRNEVIVSKLLYKYDND